MCLEALAPGAHRGVVRLEFSELVMRSTRANDGRNVLFCMPNGTFEARVLSRVMRRIAMWRCDRRWRASRWSCVAAMAGPLRDWGLS
jgi:hypothetical protein